MNRSLPALAVLLALIACKQESEPQDEARRGPATPSEGARLAETCGVTGQPIRGALTFEGPAVDGVLLTPDLLCRHLDGRTEKMALADIGKVVEFTVKQPSARLLVAYDANYRRLPAPGPEPYFGPFLKSLHEQWEVARKKPRSQKQPPSKALELAAPALSPATKKHPEPDYEASKAAAAGDYEKAVVYQTQVFQEQQRGRYNLACYLSRVGRVADALYYLQETAIHEGIDASWAEQDSDLAQVRADPRWKQLLPFLHASQNYWTHAPIQRDDLALPRNYDGKSKIPVAIWLHGIGVSGKLDDLGSLADVAGIAIVGVDGTFSSGPSAFRWSEGADLDLERVEAALERFKDRAVFDREQTLLFGFSQGGLVAGELISKHPERFAGALALSPGGRTPATPLVGPSTNDLSGRVVYCNAGGGEHPDTLKMTQGLCAQAKKQGATIDLAIDPEQSVHSLPAGFFGRFRTWVEAVREARPEAPTPAPSTSK